MKQKQNKNKVEKEIKQLKKEVAELKKIVVWKSDYKGYIG